MAIIATSEGHQVAAPSDRVLPRLTAGLIVLTEACSEDQKTEKTGV
jgi:hypothetical protein